jgi:3-oxoacyl-[acyl-carrier protein] reductase
MNLNHAKILITGGSTGIGYEIAKQLKLKGADLVICSRNKQEIENKAKEIGVTGFRADISVEMEVIDLVKFAYAKMNGINVLINNAGIAYLGPLTDTSIEDFSRIWETNVKGAFLVAKEVSKIFKSQSYGNIINISSTAGKKGFANGTAYCASKFALTGMTECWRDELRKFNVRVMQVNPSEVITPLINKLGFEPSNIEKKLQTTEIAHIIVSMLEMNDVGFITDATVWATNP